MRDRKLEYKQKEIKLYVEGCELGERMMGTCAKSLSFYTERGADFFSTCLSPHTGAAVLQCTASLLLMNSSMNSPHKNDPQNRGGSL